MLPHATTTESSANLCNVHRHDECHKLLNARVDGTSLLHLVAVFVAKSWIFEGRAFSSFPQFVKSKNTQIPFPVTLNLRGEPCTIYDKFHESDEVKTLH